jgi:hypothetical protein
MRGDASRVPTAVAPNTGAVSDVVFSPDGSMLATAGNDGDAGVWDVQTQGLIGDSLAGGTLVSGLNMVAFGRSPARSGTATSRQRHTWPAVHSHYLSACEHANASVCSSPDGDDGCHIRMLTAEPRAEGRRPGMNRAPDRLYHAVAVVLCVRVVCTLAENDAAGVPSGIRGSRVENQPGPRVRRARRPYTSPEPGQAEPAQ